MKYIARFLILLFVIATNVGIVLANVEGWCSSEKTLEIHPQTCLEKSFADFSDKGGTFVYLNDDVTFTLKPNDIVFPSCSRGNNRSQTLWNLLRPFKGVITLMPPHATSDGFDPYNGMENWHHESPNRPDDEFILWAGVKKSQKFGWDVFGDCISHENVSSNDLQSMLEYYNTHYYNPENLGKQRRVYITFAQNAHVHLYRLSQTNASLENVVVVCFPLEDLIRSPLAKWKTYPRSEKCYRQFGKLLSSHLDVTLLHKSPQI